MFLKIKKMKKKTNLWQKKTGCTISKPEVSFSKQKLRVNKSRKYRFETGSIISEANLPFLEQKLPILSLRAHVEINEMKKKSF